jgi:TolB-like protein
MLVVGCAGSAKPAENPSGLMTLDQALNEAANRIDERISRGAKIAPLNFNSPHDRFSNYVLEELTANLVESRILTVVDRREIDLIRNEFDFQFSGEVGDDSMQRMGQMLGAQSIISGNFTDMGGFIRIMIRVLNVQNATVEVQYRANIVNDAVTTALLTGGRANVAATTPRQTASGGNSPAAQPVTPVIPPPPAYRIGDTGPAGGIIFFDKGNNSGGWRYLEAAPSDIPQRLFMTSEAVSVESQRAVGTGRSNTRAIMVQANNLGGGFGWAAQACDAFELNGFNDWFLPSRDELNFMYGNLHMRNLGGFSPDWYWSSTYDGHFARNRNWWSINFSDGRQAAHSGNRDASTTSNQFRVRAIRQF